MKKITFLIIVLLFTLSLSAQVYNIGHTSITFVDPARNNQNVSTEIYYPAVNTGNNVAVVNGVFPYVVFGHGFMMGENAYFDLSDTLVSKGYIVIFVTTNAGTSTNHLDFGVDLSFLCSQFYSLNASSSPSALFLGKINNKKAIVGHSMGGGSAILGAQNNTNINAIICLSPMGATTPSAISASHLVTVPALIIGAMGDSVCPEYSGAIPIYDSLASSCKVFISIKGGGHCLYANSNWACDFGENSAGSTITITRTQQQVLTRDFMTPWLNYYLKNDESARTIFYDSLQTSPRINCINGCICSPTPTIGSNGPTTFCQGDSVTLNASAANYFLWSNNSTTQSITISTAGNYIVTIGNTNGCLAPSLATTVTVNPLPATPIITPNGTILTSSSANGNQWFLNGIALTNATSQNLTVTQSGNYTLSLTINGCTSTSLPYNCTTSGIKGLSENNAFLIIPNPSNGKFRVVIGNLNPVKIKIYNIIGESIYESETLNSEIDLSSKLKGIYFIEITTRENIYKKKLLIE